MSDKSIGIIGQKYEDRKTGKSGILESRDDKYKTLLFRADDGSTFNISNSTFRSNWRKTREEEVNTEEVIEQAEEVVETTEEVVESTDEEVESTDDAEPEKKEPKKKRKSEKKESQQVQRKNYEGITKEDAIAKFAEAIMKVRLVEVNSEANRLNIMVDDMTVININYNGDGTFKLAMLPDIFTIADWRGVLQTGTIKFNASAEDYLGVIVDTKESCIAEILDIITETVKDINLYGYINDDNEESEETTDGEN